MKAFEDYLSKGETHQAKEILVNSKNDIDPSAYWFNWGRLQAEDGHWAEARIAFLKSQKFQMHEETKTNLQIVEKYLAVSEVESPRTIKDHVIHSTYIIGTELAITLNLALLVVGLFNLKRTKSKKSFVSILAVMLLISGLSIWTRTWPWSIAEEEVSVYHGPSAIFDKVIVIPKGIKVLGLEKDSWIKVIYPSRFEGWIKKENISEL